jgi:hypothetical protein
MQIVRNENPESVLNCDETSWQLYPKGIRTCADKRSQDVAISVAGDEMYGLMATATVRLGHQKWPLCLLAKGEPIRCEATQLGDLDENVSDDSSSG